MNTKILLGSLALTLFAAVVGLADERSAAAPSRSKFRIVGYLPYSQVARLDPDVCKNLTDAIFFSLEPTRDGGINRPLKDAERQFLQAIRRQGVRTHISFGGDGRSDHFAAVAADDRLRARFVANVVQFVETNHFDGVDIDWESPVDKKQSDDWGKLLSDLKAALRPKGRELSIAIAGWQGLPRTVIDAVDFVQLMAYDLAGRHSTMEFAVSETERLLKRGVPASKICLGVPLYGRGIEKRNQVLTYAEIVRDFRPAAAADADEIRGFYFNGPLMVERKLQYAIDNGLGGLMVFAIGQDTQDETSLLNAIANSPLLVSRRSAAEEAVLQTPGLVGFWTFAEPAGGKRRSLGTANKLPLVEVGGPIARVKGGAFSGYSIQFKGQQYLRLPHAEMGQLDIHGKEGRVTMFAVLKMEKFQHATSVAGVWGEGEGEGDDTGTRQYAMLISLPMYGGDRQFCAHISNEGGPTRRADGSRFPWCVDYAATKSEVPVGKWVSLAFTYDSKYVRAYFNGKLEPRELNPSADHRDDPYFTKGGAGGGSRGMNPYYHGRGIFQFDPATHAKSKPGGPSDFTIAGRYVAGSFLKGTFIGRMAGVAVFNRALSGEEIEKLHLAAGIEKLNRDTLNR